MSSQSWPGRFTSSMYSPWPRMKRGSSLRLTEWPMPPISGLVRSSRSVSVVMTSLSSASRGRFGGDRLAVDRLSGDDRGGLRGREFSGGLLDRLDDVHVARATTEVAADALADLRFVRVGVLGEEPGRLHDHPRRAEAALQAVLIPERLLERMKGRLAGHPLDGLELTAIGLDSEHRARLRARAVDVDGARAAVARVAPDVRPGQPEVIAQEMDEEEARLDIRLVRLTVDGHRDVLGSHRSGLLRGREGAFSGAAESPESQLRGHRPLVFDRTAHIAERATLRAGGRTRRAEQVIGRGVANQDGFGIGRRERGFGDAGEADPGSLDVAGIVQPNHGGDTDGREVADLALELLVRPGRCARPMNHAYLGQDLGRLDGGLE